MGAAKAMGLGDWQTCRDLINAIKVWDLLPDTEAIKTMLEE
jgi:translation initiation factor 3 subunit C